ncbi:MAG TPA: Gfo/Idh/MocA family oxidoreductase, partial [Anaerolineaceae bacterium]|nr:Gfo/Idh/MocA family oxidoreductase [Anaerolineaceae bacterium]
HMDVALPTARAGANLLIEKPVSDTLDGLAELQETLDKHGKRAMTGFHFRYHPVLQDIKRVIQAGTLGKIYYAKAHWGEYLPDWHPWEDYRQTYAARADLGGGVLNTLSHPFDYLRWLLGEVETLGAQLAHLSALELSVEDHADISLKFASGAMASVHLDYYQKPDSHTLDITFEKGRIAWDNARSSAVMHYADGRPPETLLAPEGFERNTMYLEEMRAFLSLCRGETLDYCSLRDGIRAQQIVMTAKRSNAAGGMLLAVEW